MALLREKEISAALYVEGLVRNTDLHIDELLARPQSTLSPEDWEEVSDRLSHTADQAAATFRHIG